MILTYKYSHDNPRRIVVYRVQDFSIQNRIENNTCKKSEDLKAQ